MKYFITIFLLFSCTSKVKEGADLSIYNETGNDIFIVDKYTWDNLNSNTKVQIFTEQFMNSNTMKTRPYLKEEYITMYTNKTIFLPLDKYDRNKAYNSLIFYFIKRDDLAKTKQEILSNKLYDSININLNRFHQRGSDNHIYIDETKIIFKNK